VSEAGTHAGEPGYHFTGNGWVADTPVEGRVEIPHENEVGYHVSKGGWVRDEEPAPVSGMKWFFVPNTGWRLVDVPYYFNQYVGGVYEDDRDRNYIPDSLQRHRRRSHGPRK